MNKDNLLFTLFGLVLGFVMAWLMYEKITLRQPPRLTQDQLATAMSGQAVPGPNSVPSAPAGPPQAGPQGAAPGGAPQIDTSQLDALQAQLQQKPDDPELILAVANESFDIASKAGKAPFVWQQARDHYLQYLSLKEPNPDVLSDLGVTYRELGQFEEALQTFQQAEKMAPEHWQSKYNQVIVLAFDLKKYDKAQTILDDLRKEHPGNQDIEQLAAAVARVRSAA
ncbi:MAG: tetratricopeptide repeat protein [Acidobacteriota bacterium]